MMKKVKTKRKYISGILMLLSATIVFFPLVSIGGIEISIKSAIQLYIVDTAVQEQLQDL